MRTDCGSHTHTVLPEADRLLVYVQSYDVGGQNYRCANTGPQSHDKISVVEIPKANPAAAKVVSTPVLFPDGGNPGEPGGTQRATTGCHDITVYQEIGLAAGACTGEGAIIDITDPVNPKVIASVEDPNFAFWHSATISQDGKKVLFTDELGGGSAPTCNSTIGPNKGADAIYDITDPANPKFMSYFKIPREQTNLENCVAHNGNAIPIPGRDVLIQSWYQGGTRSSTGPTATTSRSSPGSTAARTTRRAQRARRLLVDLLLQRVHLRLRDPARLRRVQGRGQRVRQGGPLQGQDAERADAVQPLGA